MSGRSRGKYMTITMLKRRGWTEELARELLPKPRCFHGDGHPFRAWEKADVLLAEAGPRFTSGQTQGETPTEQIGRAHV